MPLLGAVAGVIALSLAGSCAKQRQSQAGEHAGPATARTGAVAAPTFEVEYRQISKFPTCLGNRRIKVDADAGVYLAVNATECPRGERWSAPYPATPARTLSDAERQHLLDVIRESGFLELAARYANDDRDDGYVEEIDVTIAGTRHSVVVDNVDQPPFMKVRRALVSAAN